MAKKRVRLNEKSEKQGLYFTSKKANLEFVNSGCTLLDCVLGGGYALGRMVNIVGDKSTAKTALLMEASANFINKYPDGLSKYRDIEAAFDKDYQEAMGIPVDQIDFGEDEEMDTVEDFYRDMNDFLDQQIKSGNPGLYGLDSLDALSDEAEMARSIDKGTYGQDKAKKMSELFRKLTRKIEKSRTLPIIISQVRDNIGVTFGERHRRSGGKAMDFYASQILWLAHMKILTKTSKKVERPYGILVKAKCKKNKVGMPFRECVFPFVFGYGVADLSASLTWLKEVSQLGELGIKEKDLPLNNPLDLINTFDDDEYRKLNKKASKLVKSTWNEIEERFIPKARKY